MCSIAPWKLSERKKRARAGTQVYGSRTISVCRACFTAIAESSENSRWPQLSLGLAVENAATCSFSVGY